MCGFQYQETNGWEKVAIKENTLLNMGSEEAVLKSRRKVAEGNKAVKTGCGIIS